MYIYVHLMWYLHALTVDGQVVGCSLLAHWVADETQVRAVVGAADRLEGQGVIADREAEAAARKEGPAVLHPQPTDGSAGGLAAQVGGAVAFDEDGIRARDGSITYWNCQHIGKPRDGEKECIKMIVMVTLMIFHCRIVMWINNGLNLNHLVS